MKRLTLFYTFLLFTVAQVTAQTKYEVRAVWLTTIGGIDWPRSYAHDGMGISQQKRQFTYMLDALQQAGINTILLQTRVRATTIYPSDFEPWDGCLSGKPGRSPGYDPLQFAIDECHRRGMELHAWVVTIPIGKWNTYGCQQLRRRYPSLIRKIGDEGYMNPESSTTADYLADICTEITRHYDLDGIHLDYIRYPETWRGAKSTHHITHIVESIHHKIKTLKPWVKLSCSPIGKYSDLTRYSSRGWNALKQVAQDAQGWLRDGLMDQLYPMMYFQGNNFYPFAIDWQEHANGRTIVSGLGVYMLHPSERNWPLEEVKRQLNVTRHIGMGHCFFRAKFLLDNTKGILHYASWFDRHPALVPPMTWTHNIAPTAPTKLTVSHTIHGDALSWSGAHDRSDGPYLTYNVYASSKSPVDTSNPQNLIAIRRPQQHLNISHSSPHTSQFSLHYAVTAVDRYGNESEAAQDISPTSLPPHPSILLHNDGRKLCLPQQHDAEYLAVLTLQGIIVHTYRNRPEINISSLSDGIYELRSLHKKGIMHRLGFFIVKR